MSSLRFFCAASGGEFDLGFETDEDTFHRHRLKLVAARCPLCGRTHRFLLADAQPQTADPMEPPPPRAPLILLTRSGQA